MHCKRVHNLVAQIGLFDGEATQAAANELLAVRRTSSVFDAADGEQFFKDSNSSTYRDPSS